MILNVSGREEEVSSNRDKVQEESAAIAPFAAWLVRLHKLESLNFSGLLALLFTAVLFYIFLQIDVSSLGCYFEDPDHSVLIILKSLFNMFSLVSLNFDIHVPFHIQNHYGWHWPYNFFEEFCSWTLKNAYAPHDIYLEQILTECRLNESGRWILLHRHMQQIMFCHRVLQWNIFLQCSQMRLSAPPRPTQCMSLCLQPLTSSQQCRVLCISGYTLLLLKKFMGESGRGHMLRGQFRCALHLANFNSAVTAARLFNTFMTRVVVLAAGERKISRCSLIVSLKDTVAAVKAKLARLSCAKSSCHHEISSAIRLCFAGVQLQDHRCLAEYNIMSNDCIDMTVVECGMTLFVGGFEIQMQPSNSVGMMKFILNFREGLALDSSSSMLYMPEWQGRSLNNDDGRLFELNIVEGSRIESKRQIPAFIREAIGPGY